MEEIELKIGGITYDVEVDVDEDYVCGVMSVEVYDGESFHDIEMKSADLEDFYNRYQDELNEAYTDEKAARAQLAAEERWERENDR